MLLSDALKILGYSSVIVALLVNIHLLWKIHLEALRVGKFNLLLYFTMRKHTPFSAVERFGFSYMYWLASAYFKISRRNIFDD